jgi:Trypsin
MGMVNSDDVHDSIYASQYVVHEDYNSNGKNNNDIALLELQEEAPLSGKLLNYNL